MLDSIHIKGLEKMFSNDFNSGGLNKEFYHTAQKIIDVVSENHCSIWELKLITDYIFEYALVKSDIQINIDLV